MDFLPFKDFTKLLRPKYRWATTVLCLGGLLAGFLPWALFGLWLAHALGIPFYGPAKAHPNTPLWFVIFMPSLLVFMASGYAAGFMALAAILRWFYGWTPARVRELIFESKIPAHWLSPTTNV